jgi:mercuric ion transport protein
MTETNQIEATQVQRGRFGGPLLVAGSGFAAAFCAASCCGLPVLLGSVGLGSGWLVTLAWLAAPHRTVLLVAAVVLMASGAGAFLWRRRVTHCATEISNRTLAASALLITLLFIGGILTILGYLYS